MVASPPAPKMNGLAPVSPEPSLSGLASDQDASANPALEKTMKSIPKAWDVSLVI